MHDKGINDRTSRGDYGADFGVSRASPKSARRPMVVRGPTESLRNAARWWLRGWLSFPARSMLEQPRFVELGRNKTVAAGGGHDVHPAPARVLGGHGSAGTVAPQRPGGLGPRASGSSVREAGSRVGSGWSILFVAAFAAIYLIWGSTYLAIAWGVETIPPLSLMGVRFVLAGGVLYGWGRLRDGGRPTAREWRVAVVAGALLFLVTHGLIAWAEQRIASGLAALLGASVPVWMVLLDWLRPSGVRPTGRMLAGIAAGLIGIGVLVVPGNGVEATDLLSAAAVLVAAIAWSAGSIFARGARLPKSHALAAGMQLLAGGVLLLGGGIVLGETTGLDVGAVSVRSVLALGYLTVFGSLVAYSAYLWLLRVTTPARVATHAFVNPVVAVALGWFAGEPVTWAMAAAGVLVLVAVVTITWSARARGHDERHTDEKREPRAAATSTRARDRLATGAPGRRARPHRPLAPLHDGHVAGAAHGLAAFARASRNGYGDVRQPRV